MNYQKSRSRFSKQVRIDPKQLNWLKENKDCRTSAGFLDRIINKYKKHHYKKILNKIINRAPTNLINDNRLDEK